MKKHLYILTICLLFNLIIRAQVGSNDASFDPGTGANSTVNAIKVLSTGKILIGGSFGLYNGQSRMRIARVNTDGSDDVTFNAGGSGFNTAGSINALLELPDGDIMAAGTFTTYNGSSARRVTRLNPDGSYDSGFQTNINGPVHTIYRLASGNYMVGGQFTTVAGVSRPRIARLTTTGGNDATFTPGTGPNLYPYAFAEQPDGKIIVGGNFTTYNGSAYNRIVRVTSTGSVDATFNPGTGAVYTPSATTTVIRSVVLLSNGQVVVGGLFNTFNGVSKGGIIRLNSDGSVDNTFNAGGTGANYTITSILLLPDGKFIITGAFTSYNGVSVNRIARLNSDGTLDTSFNPGAGADNYTYSADVQADGNILLGGNFLNYASVARTRLARINACPSVSLSLTGQTNVTCNGQANGSATVSASGGSSFTYTWTPSAQTTSVATGLSAGTYTCLAANQCGNTNSITITITEPSPMVITTGGTSTTCIGANFGLSASASGGNGPYSYTWQPGNLTGANATVNPATTTVYTVTATDASNCTATALQTASVVSCPGPVLTGTSCGASLTSLDQVLNFTSISGATNYRLEITNNQQPFSTVNVRGNNLTYFKMSWISGIQYNRTYNVRISAYAGGAWQPYGNTCTVTTPSTISTAQFVPASCNTTLTALDQQLDFNLVLGATNYRMEIISAAQSFTNVNVRNNTVSYFKMSWVSGIQYNRTYSVRISAYVNGAWQPYGTACNITTPASIPTTQLSSTVCNTSVAARSTVFTFNPVIGATNYKLEIINAGQPLNVTNFRNSTNTNFALSYVSGTTVGTTYNIRVAANVGGVWAAYGPMCQVTALSAKGDADFANSEYYRLNQGETFDNETDFKLAVYPNPTRGNLNIEIDQDAVVEITNVIGQKIIHQDIKSGVNPVDLAEYGTGIYFVTIQAGTIKKTVKVIVSQ